MNLLRPRLILLFVGLLLLPASLLAQYEVKSPYLQNPSLAIGYVDSCAKFWEPTWDATYGGFYKDVNREGIQTSEWKSSLTQSRHAYGFVRAYQMTGNVAYLDTARAALQWMIEHAWDYTYGGWFWNIKPEGNIYDTNASKTAFYQHYALLGIAAYVEATRDSAMTDWLYRGYETLENQFWDSRYGAEGYYDEIDHDGSNPRNKSFNATVDAVTTHLLLLDLMDVDSLAGHSISDRLHEMGNEMVNRLVGTMDDYAIGFVESFDSNWGWTDVTPSSSSYENRTLMGHVLKTGWCLARLEQIMPDPAWLPAAEKAVNDVWDNAYDHTYGGPYKDFDRVSGQEFTYGKDPGVKAWWQMEQAITSGLQLYRQTGDEHYLMMADSTTLFYMQYFVDHTYGDVYADRTRTGGTPWDDNKGSGGKAGYHSIETGYYLYTYGGLMLTGDPVSLHYHIAAADSDRTLLMRPIALYDSLFTIAAVTLDDVDYSSFDATAHTLSIPAGTGGDFYVTYQGDVTSGAREAVFAGLPSRVTIDNTYPNPFNGRATVVFNLPSRQNVRLALYDVQGREVQRVIDGVGKAGENVTTVDASRLSSGVYFLHLATPHNQATRRIVLVK